MMKFSAVLKNVILLTLMLPIWTTFAALPHGVSQSVTVDTRVVCKASEGVSGNIWLDMREIDSRLAFAESPPVLLDSGGSEGIPTVTALSPSVVPAVDGRQWVTVRGHNFAQDAVVTLRVDDEVYVIPANRTERVDSDKILIYVNVTSEEAIWSAQVTNPGFPVSAPLSFAVGFPDITPGTFVDFGVMSPGQTADRSFTVRNRGTGSVSLSVNVALPFSVVNGPFPPIVSGGQQVVTVRYQPVQAGSHEKMVVFTLGSRSLGRVVSGRSASQTGGTGTIEGTVEIPVMATTKKVPNARIEINRVDGLESLSIGRGGRTDSQGCFSVARLPSGTYKVVASPPQKYYKSYERAVITVNVTADATVTADLTLPQKTPPPVVSAKDMPIVLVRGRGKYGVNEAEYWSEVKTYLDTGLSPFFLAKSRK